MKSFLLLLLLSTLLNVSANQPPCGTWLNNSTLIVLESGTFSLSTQLLNPRYVSSIQFGGLKLRITNIGSIEIIEISNNRQVWSWGRTNINCTNSCKATFQSDGNFVLYYPDNQGVISTKTYNGAASYIYLTTQPPYFQLFNYTCEVVWPGSRGQPTFGPIARSTQDPSQNPVVLPFYHTTIPAARFKEYFGVCTHLSHGWSASLVTSLAPFVGTSTIRDGIPNANQYAAYKAAVDAGLKINFLFGGPSNISGLQDQINRILTLVNNYDVPISSINNFEGFNELNNFGFTYNGINPATSYTGMAEAMKDLYLLIKSTPQFNGIRVYDLTAASFGPDAADAGLLNYSGRADYANIHAYPYKGAPGYYASRNIFYEGIMENIQHLL
ncbi:unnamed protein product [Didymodactylos carnosus]|uniref:Uncharacterized protein n=1 Tax=Didymodactylos carnosus TaxID=1234261 RepID=A0A8S2EWZ8_9BILA|nr:unnamed protein product [Didymodactylos carnosus]CAF4131747.1 unnamed protein product [Didymodactylos carnosus]